MPTPAEQKTEQKPEANTGLNVDDLARSLAEKASPHFDAKIEAAIQRALDERDRQRSANVKRSKEEVLRHFAAHLFALRLGAARGIEGIRAIAKGDTDGLGGVDALVVRSFTADIKRTIQETVFDSGGWRVPVTLAQEVIEYLRPFTMSDKLGVRTIAFVGKFIVGRQNDTVTVYWVDEGEAPTQSNAKWETIELVGKKAAAQTRISNDSLRNAAMGDMGAANDMMAAFAVAIDAVRLGTQKASKGKPAGLHALIDSSQIFATSGTSVANYISDVDKAITTVKKANLPFMLKPGWAMTPDIESALLKLRDNAGWVFRQEMLDRGTLRGYPYLAGTNFPAGYLTFGAWENLLAGIETDMAFSTHQDTYATTDETLYRGVMKVDNQVRHTKAFSSINYN